MQIKRASLWTVLLWVLVVGAGLSSQVFADEHIRGVVREHRSDGTLTVQTDNALITVVLDDSTSVSRTDGMRTSHVQASTLVPGLRVIIEGVFQSPERFLAQEVKYTRADLKTAQAIAGGVNTTDQRSLANQERLQQHAGQLTQQGKDIAANRERTAANERAIVGTAGSIAATNARISNIDDYNVIKTVTVFFSNGKAAISSKSKTELQQLANDTKNVNPYLVQVQGYASAVGPEALNQRLSAQRADAVVAVLQQNGVPLTSIVVPAAMGISEQVASNKTAKGQAENRRTIITLLQSKGINDTK